ncbi:hypothetical protein QU845_24810, partial [Escherichia coli]|nr:hypothetical protein [Escherichia coli]
EPGRHAAFVCSGAERQWLFTKLSQNELFASSSSQQFTHHDKTAKQSTQFVCQDSFKINLNQYIT